MFVIQRVINTRPDQHIQSETCYMATRSNIDAKKINEAELDKEAVTPADADRND